MIYAARHAGRTHLWGYVPGDAAPVRLTVGEWDDIHPAASLDGRWIAFSSNREGQWDLYLLELPTGSIRRLTDTPGFEGSPTWSPDGMWLACETYYDGNYNIWVIPVVGDQAPIQLTSNPAADISPAWDPNGRRIAFVSYRDGNSEIFLADLENPDDRFQNLSNTPDIAESDPTFSPDGSKLSFTARSDGVQLIMIIDLEDPSRVPIKVGPGAEPAWSPDGLGIVAVAQTPNQTHLQTYTLQDRALTTLGLPWIPGIQDVTWMGHGMPGEYYTETVARNASTPLYLPSSQASSSGRYQLVDLPDIEAPHPLLSDQVDEVFNALRSQASKQIGWDLLASLENAFVGLNDPLPPGYAYNDWLFTGRAFAFNRSAFQAGWVELVREDFGAETYWRVFVRVDPQNGSLGMPLRHLPWDLNARDSRYSSAYDKGGMLRSGIPQGYYIDFTQLALDYGFERVPALSNWRTFYPSARYNEFAYKDGLDWYEAMLEIYPPSAIVTPTAFKTPTSTPTRTPRPTATPWWWRWRTPTPVAP
jgi:TolB protein